MQLRRLRGVTGLCCTAPVALSPDRQSLTVRFPVRVLDTIRTLAESNRRSLNSEILILLELGLRTGTEPAKQEE